MKNGGFAPVFILSFRCLLKLRAYNLSQPAVLPLQAALPPLPCHNSYAKPELAPARHRLAAKRFAALAKIEERHTNHYQATLAKIAA